MGLDHPSPREELISNEIVVERIATLAKSMFGRGAQRRIERYLGKGRYWFRDLKNNPQRLKLSTIIEISSFLKIPASVLLQDDQSWEQRLKSIIYDGSARGLSSLSESAALSLLSREAERENLELATAKYSIRRAVICGHCGRFEAGLSWLHQSTVFSLHLDRRWKASLYYNLAFFSFKVGKLDDCSKFARIATVFARTRDEKGHCLWLRGLTEGGVKNFERAISELRYEVDIALCAIDAIDRFGPSTGRSCVLEAIARIGRSRNKAALIEDLENVLAAAMMSQPYESKTRRAEIERLSFGDQYTSVFHDAPPAHGS